jgi:hypothetical protein
MRFAASEKKTTANGEGQVRRLRSGVGVPVRNVLSDMLNLPAYDAWFLLQASGSGERKTDSIATSTPHRQPQRLLALGSSQGCLPRLPR